MGLRSEPTISIITVVWNNLEGLKATAASIRAQSYERIEHIIVDGGSTDGTLEWLSDREQDPSSKLSWSSENDNGIYDAMNKGAARATGNLLLFLNGGDSLHSNDVLDRVASRWAEGSWEWGYGILRYIDKDRRALREYCADSFSRRKVSRGLAFVPHPCTFMSRSLFERLGPFDESFGFSADQEMAVRASALTYPEFLPFTISDYLIEGAHGASSYAATAARYHEIRRRHGLLVGAAHTTDMLYTRALATFWKSRSLLSAAKRLVAR